MVNSINVRRDFNVILTTATGIHEIAQISVRGVKGFVTSAPFYDKDGIVKGWVTYHSKTGYGFDTDELKTIALKILSDYSPSGYNEKLGGNPLPYKMVRTSREGINILKHIIRLNLALDLSDNANL